MHESAQVAGAPKQTDVPKPRRVVNGDSARDFKAPTGIKPRRQRRGG